MLGEGVLSDGTPGIGFGGFVGKTFVNIAAWSSFDDEAEYWYFVDVLVYSHVNVRASANRAFHAICKLCGTTNNVLPKNLNGAFSVVLQNQRALTDCKTSVSATSAELDLVCVAEETVAYLIHSLTFEEMDWTRERDALHDTLEHPNTKF